MFETKKLSGKQLAKLLDVAPASLSGAAKKDHLCKGKAVAEWAVRNQRGKLIEYDVPASFAEAKNKPNLANKPIKEPNKAETNTVNEPKPVATKTPAPTVRENSEDNDSESWTDALIFAGLGFGVLWLMSAMQNENEGLKGEIWAYQNKANQANKKPKKSEFVTSQFLPE